MPSLAPARAGIVAKADQLWWHVKHMKHNAKDRPFLCHMAKIGNTSDNNCRLIDPVLSNTPPTLHPNFYYKSPPLKWNRNVRDTRSKLQEMHSNQYTYICSFFILYNT